jgi:N-carbamoylputrescine amidase
MTKIKAGLIQMSLKGTVGEDSPDTIKKKMIDAHAVLIAKAASEGVQVLGMQEFFNLPYFPASEDVSWYGTAEKVPDGPTISAMRELAKQHSMVLVAPIYEETMPGVYYNTAAVIDADGSYLGSFRKVHIPQIVGYNEKLFFKPGDLGYPVFDTAYCKLGVYICYDRHFPEGWRELALNGAEIVINPSATTTGLSDHIWQLEQPAAAVANGIFVGAINRVGLEAPWNVGTFYGTSYFSNPRGQIMAEAPSDSDALVTADVDLGMIREVRETWQFYRDRRPETYTTIAKP